MDEREVDQSRQLQDRLIDYAVRIVKLSGYLSTTATGQHVGRQIVRSGTSPAANYSEACAAESRADFIHKLRIGSKELNESKVWRQIIGRAELVPSAQLEELMNETSELNRIIGASIRTAKKNSEK